MPKETLDDLLADIAVNLPNDKCRMLRLLNAIVNQYIDVSEVRADMELGLLVLYRASDRRDILGVYKPTTFKEEREHDA